MATPENHGKSVRPPRWFLVVAVLVAIAAPLAVSYMYLVAHVSADFGYICGAGVLAVVTFYAVWSYERHTRDSTSADAMREAIAASFVLVYLLLVIWAIFFNDVPSGSGEQTNPITKDLLQSFTYVTGVVVGFYFASVAVGKFARNGAKNEARSSTTSGKPPDDPPSGS
ncbi:MAG: hypothetical protein J2P17_19415 [Mycobacterium sp.]|nr:hypothetical protein [Mycobacterium sp.]